MEATPCKPPLPATPGLRVSDDALSTRHQDIFNSFSVAFLAGGSSCHSEYVWSIDVPSMPQSTAIVLAIVAVGCVTVLHARLGQVQRAGVVHQGSDAALSCRLCLIACNSRQFDEVGVGQ
jgi:hypothetical protein